MRIYALGLSLLCVAPAQAEVSQFDLECIGSRSSVTIDGQEQPSNEVPDRVRLRIDLGQQLWCNGGCAYPRPLTFTDKNITLTAGKVVPNGKWIDTGVIRRADGFLVMVAGPEGNGDGQVPKLFVTNAYRCNAADFTGIPKHGF